MCVVLFLADVCQRGHTHEGLKEKQAAPTSVSGILLLLDTVYTHFGKIVLKPTVFPSTFECNISNIGNMLVSL